MSNLISNGVKKNLFAILALFALVFFPLISQAYTITELKEMIAKLQMQIEFLKSQSEDDPAWCYSFNNNLGLGSKGTEVTALAQALTKEKILGLTSGSKNIVNFDKDISTQVAKFQSKYGISRTGFVGSITRAKLNQLYGCNKKSVSPKSVSIYSFSGPNSVDLGKVGVWNLRTIVSPNTTFSYSVDWGEGTTYISKAQKSGSGLEQNFSLSHTYKKVGNYVVKVEVASELCQSSLCRARSSVMVRVNEVKTTCLMPSNSSFRSVEQLPVGMGPNGPVLGYWKLRFLGSNFTLESSDTIEERAYTCQANILKTNNSVIGSYDESSKILTWDGVKYKKD